MLCITGHPTVSGMFVDLCQVIMIFRCDTKKQARSKSQDPFNAQKCAAALNYAKGSYKAACNIFLMDPRRLVSRSKVPIMQGTITRMRTHFFNKPSPIPVDVLFGVPNPSFVQEDMQAGKCVRLSPAEPMLAYFEAIADDLTKGDEEVLKAWRDTLVQTSCVFERLTSEDELHKRSLQFREDLGQNFAACRMSAVQKMYDIIGLKERKEATTGLLSCQALSAYYTDGLRFAENSEKITFDFVENALMVHKRMMSNKRCEAIIMGLEDLGTQNPLDSIHKLAKICTKASREDMIEWSLELMVDFWRSGALKSDQLAVRQLDGKQKGSNGKGLVDVLVYKRDLLRYILTEWMEPLSWSPSEKALLREACASIAGFRSKCGYIYNARHLKVASCPDACVTLMMCACCLACLALTVLAL